MRSVILLLPDGHVGALNEIATRRGMVMHDMIVELVETFIKVDAYAERKPDPTMSAEQLVGFAPRPPGAPEFP